MKTRTILCAIALMATSLFFASCSKDDDKDSNNQQEQTTNVAQGTTSDGSLQVKLVNGVSEGTYTLAYHDGIYYHDADTTYFYVHAALSFDEQSSSVNLPYIQVLMRYDNSGLGIENAYYYELKSRVEAIEQQYETRMGDWRYYQLDVSKSELRNISTSNGTFSGTLCLNMANTYEILIENKTNGDFRTAELFLTFDNYQFRLSEE
ncbi:MAG: hypothetical protein IJ620_03730 [Bacteroidales bacterium]|nr:hypothetical protein [Bacteroidales bacterium]